VLVPPVTTMIKADMKCSSVAAASVLAKVERDAMMVALAPEHPEYGWAVNKGYAAPEHMQALEVHGPCAHHRRSWRLPGVVELLEQLDELDERAVRLQEDFGDPAEEFPA
jgi:ribonuclease HII